MKNIVLSFVLVGLVFSSGCSMMSYNSAKKDYVQRVATQRAQASGDANLIKVTAQGNYVAAGIDLLDPATWDVLAEHPVRATVALLADVVAGAAATWAISSSLDSSKHSTVELNTTGNGNNSIVTLDNTGTIHNEVFAGDLKETVQ